LPFDFIEIKKLSTFSLFSGNSIEIFKSLACNEDEYFLDCLEKKDSKLIKDELETRLQLNIS
jgi:hypothetical protein